MRYNKKLTEEQITFIKENYESKGAKFCYESLNLTKSIVGSFANRNNLKVNRDVVSKNMSKDIINVQDYIEVKDSKVAYILGLIWTDGHVTFANNRTKTPLIKHSSVYYDSVDFLPIFKSLNWRTYKHSNSNLIECINKDNYNLPLVKTEMNSSWISSRSLGNYLIKYNYRDKNKGTDIHEKMDINFISHFLRGLFDGDGCITLYESGKYKQSAIAFTSSKDQDWNFLIKILNSIDVKCKVRILKHKLGYSSQLNIHDSISIYNFCKYIYKDSEGIRLERKYNKYLQFFDYKKIHGRNNKLKDILNEIR